MLRYLTFGVHHKSNSHTKAKDKQKGEIAEIRLADVLTGLKLNMEQASIKQVATLTILEA